MERPPAAESESVQPGIGSATDDAIIEGLQRQNLRWPLFFMSVFSPRFFVKVYVLGNLPTIFVSFSSMYSLLRFKMSATTASESISGS